MNVVKIFFDKKTFFDPRLKDNSIIVYADYLSGVCWTLPESNETNNKGLTSLIKSKRAEQAGNPARREFKKYKQLQEIDILEDPLQWWKENQKRYPRIRLMLN